MKKIGLEKNSTRREKAIEVIVEYISRYPSCGKNLQIIANITDKQIAKAVDQEIHIINQVAKEILSLVPKCELSSAIVLN